jgi:2-haloacid dehalogenase
MTLDDLLVRFKIEGWHETEKADFNRVWHRLRPWPDSVDGLRRLRRRFVIAPLSNGNLSLLTNMAKHADLPWDCILSTELVKHYKPDPETYLMVPELFDLQPADVMMVAAHEADLEAARKLGLRTAYVHRPLEYGPDRATKPPTVGRFDVAATDFRDLATQLGATKN